MPTLLKVKNLSKQFRFREGIFRRSTFDALLPISFSLEAGKTLAITGQNGSGKSTLAKIIAGMIEPSAGEIWINDQPLRFGDYHFRSQHIRMIFQDPNGSFNPMQTVGELLEQPLKLNTKLDFRQRRKQIFETLKLAGLSADYVRYYPSVLAGGQKQRVAFARAMILNPQIIIADEALISQDISMRAQMINLMLSLQREKGISYIFVSQDLGMLKHISDNILVLHQGKLVESGNTAEVLASPLHEITQKLVQSYFGDKLTADSWRIDPPKFP